jgi:hypothetical protein
MLVSFRAIIYLERLTKLKTLTMSVGAEDLSLPLHSPRTSYIHLHIVIDN